MTEEQEQQGDEGASGADEEPKTDREEGGPTPDESGDTPTEGATGTKPTPGLDPHE